MKTDKASSALLILIATLGLAVGCLDEGPQRAEEEKGEIASPPGGRGEGWGNAPDFILPRYGGGDLRLSSFSGRIVILNFWSPRCDPCRKEIPGLIELYEKYRDRGVEIVGVCLESGAKAKRSAQESGINYPVVFGGGEVARRYGGIRVVPTSFIIDRAGNIVRKHLGYFYPQDFEREIRELLEIKGE